MSRPSPVSSTRRVITVESRERRGSDPTVSSNKKEVQKLPSGDSDVGKHCQICGIKCQGFMPHLWRKKCIICGCGRDQHRKTVVPYETIQSMEGVSLQQSVRAQEQALKQKYVWYPKGISADMVEKYWQCIPEEYVPSYGSKGVDWREDQFMKQLPAYDTCQDVCHDMPDVPDKKRMTKFVDMRRRKFFGVGEVETLLECKSCTYCQEDVSQGSVAVIATRASNDTIWHPQCFRCSTCNELLVDMIYFYCSEDQRIYCGRHHGEKMVPRCAGCDELIFSSTYTESAGKTWHKEHLCCSQCDANICGQKPGLKSGELVCAACYEKMAARCQKCKEPIGIGSVKVDHKGASWHKECFVCKRCKIDLESESDKFFVVKGELHCEDCMEPIAQCHSCKTGIKATVSYLQHKSRTWHAECFKCVICQAWLADGQFNELDDNLICNECFVRKVSKKCTSCSEPITSKGVQFGLSTYHPKCFVCSECNRNLATGEVKVKEKMGNPVCFDCHIKSAKKCYKCHDPIMSKHTIYKGYPFHLECFTCNKCGTSVANSEFFETSLNEILCMRCGD